jgi:hypothetical protein
MTVAMTVRHADKDDIVNGIKVPAGTSIFIAPGVTNFDPDSWGPDVASFNPDRWDKLPETISNYSFLTFLQGTETPFILRLLYHLSLYPLYFLYSYSCIRPLVFFLFVSSYRDLT